VNRRHAPPLRGLALLALGLAVWQVAQAGRQSVYAPAPSQWMSQLQAAWREGVLLPAAFATLRTFLASLVVAAVLGTLVGALIGRSQVAESLLGPFLDYLRYMPAVALVPLAVLFVGYTQAMKIYVVVFGAVWPVLLQVRSGVRGIEPVLLDVGRSLRLSRRATIGKLILPAVGPSVLLGIRVAAPTALILTLVVEISTNVTGLGSLIAAAQQNFESARVYGLIALTGVLALAVNGVLAGISAYLLRYRPAA
jgi:ABC-type nitrate/sulfonate/bicarbonate transport system permease component